MALQVWSLRILSNLIWQQFAGTVVAVGLAGVAFGALLAAVRARRRKLAGQGDLAWGFLVLGAILLVDWLLITQLRYEPYRAFLLHDGAQAARLAALWTALFACATACGWLLGRCIGSSGARLRRVYAADLFGGAAGALLAGLGGTILDPPRGILACSAVSLGAGALFLRGRGCRGAVRIVAWVGSAGLAAWGFSSGPSLLHYPEGKLLHGLEHAIERTVWDPAARIDVLRPFDGVFHGAGGIAHPTPGDALPHRIVTQDGGAPTAFLGLGERAVSPETWGKYLQAAPFRLLSEPSVLIIGAGGGLETVLALKHGASRVECVEINGSLLRLARTDHASFTGRLLEHPLVHVHHAEGRHHLARARERFDLILVAGADSFAAGPGGAAASVEAYLYTRESMRAMLDRLSPRGTIAVTRRLFDPPRETLRLVATVRDALTRSGVDDPSSAICVLTCPRDLSPVDWAMVMVRPGGFSAGDLNALRRWAGERGHRFIHPSGDGMRGPFQTMITGAEAEREALMQAHPFDLRPVTDDRPFFFVNERMNRLWSDALALLRGPMPQERLGIGGVPPAVGLIVTILGGMLLGLAAIVVLIVACVTQGRQQSWRSGGSLSYFALTGCGALFAEIGLFQIGSFLIGVPHLAVSIVLAGILFGGGLGAMWLRNGRLAILGGTALVVVAAAAWFAKLTGSWAPPGMATGSVVLASISVLFGACAGAWFPAGLRLLRGEARPAVRSRAFAVSAAFAVAGAACAPIVLVVQGTFGLLLTSVLTLILAGVMLAAGAGATD